MVNPLHLSAAILVVQAPTSFGWIPRLLTSTSCNGVRTNGRAGRERVLLSATAKDDNNDNTLDDGDDSDRENKDSQPLFAEDEESAHHQLNDFVSRLETLYDMDTSDIIFKDETDTAQRSSSSLDSKRLLEEGDRVVLGDWMEWGEGPCYGDTCGGDDDVSCLKVSSSVFMQPPMILQIFAQTLIAPFSDHLQQCDIPEEFKVAAPKVDVMSFLGIRRAEPLQVQRDWD